MEHDLSLKEIKKLWHGSYRSYVLGFVFSLILTCLSFFFASVGLFHRPEVIFTVIFLGLTQAVFQLVFFLHIGQEDHPRWETIVFFVMLLVFLIIAVGTVWIMYDLNNRTMGDLMLQMNHAPANGAAK
ncbi:MAG: cytochrome C oxidase subunit IV family protein [Chlamydiia bacterium]|nr:cytochrome C oxidase subunit IV family protein [Chlamydiia bacterium]